MSDVLKGNFQTKQPVNVEVEKEETLEDRFEREAMKRLGGSIAFVSKKRVNWGAESASVAMDKPEDGETEKR